MTNERDKLIEELCKLEIHRKDYREKIADFIINDRKRIVEPLVYLGLKPGIVKEVSLINMAKLVNAICETLKNAGAI